MMPVWSPGYYRVEDYAGRVPEFSARGPDGTALTVNKPKHNRWRIQTGGGASVIVNYRLQCTHRSVTGNSVEENLAVLNGPATFITLVEKSRRPHEVRLELPAGWERSMTSLEPVEGEQLNHYRAEDYDTLADSPIVAGKMSVHEFEVEGSRHYLVDAGAVGSDWDSAEAAKGIEKLVRENLKLWGQLPFRRYVFLNVFRQAGGGLEHANSTLLTSRPGQRSPSRSWYAFVCHEYVHAFNVKRLRPAELSTLDYENPPRTGSLWISEGLTTYYGELLVCRAGLSTTAEFLNGMSSQIQRLQSAPGRLAQTLEQASLEVWNTPTSGLARNAPTNTVSYYTKGPIVGFLLDARIQAATGGRKSLDDVMRVAYQRYSGERGFTSAEFRQVAEEVAGVKLEEWFARAIHSTEELNYTEALDWYGLQFGVDAGRDWRLVVRADATEAQRARLQRLTASTANQ
jgi:predicted metalloprotease with PDZ domain